MRSWFAIACGPAAAALAAAACTAGPASGPAPARSPASPARVAAFVGVTVLPMTSSIALTDHTVLVSDGRIVELGPRGSVAVPPGALRIEGGGRFLVPGLIDMHVHPAEDGLPLFVANGVTTARVMNGRPAVLRWREAIGRGELLGPRLVVAGPTIEGRAPDGYEEVVSGGSGAPESYEDGVALVDRQAAQGYDFIKVYNNVPAEAYRGIVDAARRHGMDVTGHVPFEVGLDGVLAAGQRTIEHLRGYVEALVPSDAPERPGPDYRSRAVSLRHADRARIAGLARATADAGVWNCPTLVIRGRRPTAELAAFLGSPQAAYLPPDRRRGMVDRWRVTHLRNFTEADFARAAEGDAVEAELVRALRDGGARLCAGTDTPVPGFSLHDELALLVRAGLTPFETLDAATRSAADALRREDLGRIAPGASADLVLVAGDPRSDIGVLARPEGVMAAGRWLPRAALDGILESALARHEQAVLVADRADLAGARAVARGGMPLLSPDGERLFRIADAAARQVLLVLDAAADRPRIAFLEPLLVSDAGGGASRVIVEWVRVDGHARSYDLSPDGRTIVYAGVHGDLPRSALLAAPAAGGEPRLLATLPDPGPPAPRWSPAGARIAFTSGDGLFVLDGAAGGAPRRLATARAWDAAVAWSPDGSRIAAIHAAAEGAGSVVVVADPETGEVRRVSDAALDRHGKEAVAWHSDGHRLAYMCYCEPDHPRLGHADGRPGEPLVDLPGYWVWYGVWRPDGGAFLFFAWDAAGGGMFRMDTATGASTLLGEASTLPEWRGGRAVWTAPLPPP